MQNKPLQIFIVVFSILVAAGAIYLLMDDSATEPLPDFDLPSNSIERNVEADAGDDSMDSGRVRVAPKSDAGLDEGPNAMPASYRKALGILKGRVVEADGTPVGEMDVELFGMGAQDLIHDGMRFMEDVAPSFEFNHGKTETAEDGTFRLADVYPRSMYILGIDLDGGRATSRFLDSMPGPGEVKDIGDVVLEPSTVILGKLIDEAGEPVHGARVRAVQLIPAVFLTGLQEFRDECSFLARWDSGHAVVDPPPAVLQFYRMLPFPETLSLPDGSFRLEGAPLGNVSLIVDRAGHVNLEDHSVYTSLGEEKDMGEITFKKGVPLRGKVVDSEGEPVANVEVRAGPIYGFNEFVVLQPLVRTNEEGVFEMPGMQPRSTFAVARQFRGDPWVMVGPFHPEYSPPEIRLPPSYDLKLTVVDHENEPARDIRLKIREGGFLADIGPFRQTITPVERMKVTSKGEVEIAGLPSGEYEVIVTAKDCGVTRESITIQEEALRHRVVLKPAYKATVRVLKDSDRSPVEWARVYASQDEESWLTNPTSLSSTRTDESGLAVLHRLNPETYRLNVAHPDFAVAQVRLEVPVSDEVVVLLKPGGVLEGKVHETPGVCEGPFMIAIQLEDAAPGFDGDMEAETPRFTSTDLEGEFRVTNLTPGQHSVNVLKRLLDKNPMDFTEVLRRGPIMAERAEVYSGETSYVELSLNPEAVGPGADVSGQVRIDGVPAEGARVSMYAKRRYETTVDENGNFSLGKVPVGDFKLRLFQIPGPMGKYELRMRFDVKVNENEPVFEVIDLLTGTLSGSVVSQETGRALPGEHVRVRIEGDNAPYWVEVKTVTGLDGKFSFESLPVGSYSVKVDQDAFGCRPVTGVKVFPGGKAGPVRLVLETPIVVEGRISVSEDLSESRWLGLAVRDVDAEDNWEWIRVNAKTLSFSSSALVPGFYTVRLVGNFSEVYPEQEIEIPQGGITGLVLHFQPE